ncbi:hypothetical protein L218DRAFT_892568 [Marasmius fiardii PR-910]|nr:hypothetical protein L218DRAFT_892568 [Marasmius fiardii PR-910]
MAITPFDLTKDESPPPPARHGNPVVAFIIGLAIILLASILNAAGLNLTKLDHVRTNSIPKASRRKDWLRPLWLLGMLLYILSQIIGSTLALEYMRAEYVAPLGSTSLVFNFLFARFLVGTPVTSMDIYGTVVVILGVIGIVAFGSINSGLASETDVLHLTYLWRRGGWLLFFFLMSFALLLLLLFTTKLDAILAARSDLSAVAFAAYPSSTRNDVNTSHASTRDAGIVKVTLSKAKQLWARTSIKISQLLETWTAPKDDNAIAWTLGIGWACCGGGLAGGTLVFAKATVKLLSGSLSHENPGNQFGHPAPIFTIILLVCTAVLQIVCLNRGLKVYDSTLVVPVFYGVYTATGFLNSLIFNDEVDAYKSWTLFLIFVSIMILISGVVLLTHKKPEPAAIKPVTLGVPTSRTRSNKVKGAKISPNGEPAGEQEVLWTVGDAEDDGGDDDGDGEDEDIDHHQNPLSVSVDSTRTATGSRVATHGEEGRGLMEEDVHEHEGAEGDVEHDKPRSDRDEEEEFGQWTDAERR